jgi:DNA polymerase-3 subunit beta
MKIDIDKRDLMSLIGKTQNIVEKRNTMPILVNVLLETSDNSFKVFATDLEVSLIDSVKALVHEPGSVVVGAKSLFDIAKELKDGPVQLTKKENNWLEIRQGKYVGKIIGISSEEYPIFPSYEGSNYLNFPGATLKEMIDKTIYSVSTDETRYHLNGVYFELQNQNCKMVATDGHRLSLINRSNPDAGKIQPQSVIIPKKGLHEIRKLLENIEGDVRIAIEGAQFILLHQSTTLMIRLIEGKYPNYQQLIPQKLKTFVIINKDLLSSSLKLVSLHANQKSKGVMFIFSKGKLEISSSNPEMGDAKEEIELNYDGPELKVGFNSKYITDVLNSIQDPEIEFHLNDQLSPSLIKPHKDPNYTCVVMPMRM